jgi:predicted Zn-dependent protease
MDKLLFKLIGIAPRSLEPDLQKTALSLRALTSAERKAIEVRKIRIVQANKNETLKDLNDRTNNVVNTYITSILNGIEEGATLNKNQAVKIIRTDKYFK